MIILPFIIVIVIVNMWGSYANKSRAKQWVATYVPLLQSEYASVGFGGKKGPSVDDVASKGLAKAMAENKDVPEDILKPKAKNEFITYATGRQNVAWLDIKLTLHKRFNPALWLMESIFSFFFDSVDAPMERMEATATCFDGKEKEYLAQSPGNVGNSSYDSFVWAVVHKDKMKQLRDDRYDLSLTATRDNPKLPDWATIMTESAEITDVMLTPDLIKAINETGEDLEALIVSDQPIDAPKKYAMQPPRIRRSAR